MLTAVDVVLIATTGYVYTHLDVAERYKVARLAGHKLYFRLLILGLFFYGPGWAFSNILDTPTTEDPFYFMILAGSTGLFMLGFLWYSGKVYTQKDDALKEAWQKGDDLEIVCAAAVDSYQPVQLSLKSRKCYIGYIARTLEPDDDANYLTIIPMSSGYRSADDMSVEITHEYEKLIAIHNAIGDTTDPNVVASLEEQLNLARLVIPRSEIVTCHIFDFDIHADVMSQRRTNKKP